MEQIKLTISKDILNQYISKLRVKKELRREKLGIRYSPDLSEAELDCYCEKISRVNKKLDLIFAEELQLAKVIATEKEARFLVSNIVEACVNHSDTTTNETIFQILGLLNFEVV